jgi:hypothetical protein
MPTTKKIADEKFAKNKNTQRRPLFLLSLKLLGKNVVLFIILVPLAS